MKILITDDAHPLLSEGLLKLGFQLSYQPDILWNEALEIIHEYDGIVVNSKMVMNKQMLDRAICLKFIARLGSGLDIIDLPETNRRGIKVFSAPDGNANAVAEHALGMLLTLANKLLQADHEVRQFQWFREKNRGFELSGKTLGIIGFGNNGSALAKKMAGWNMRILAYDKYKIDYTQNYPHVEASDLKTIQKEADFISLHIPLTDETHHYIDEAFIANCAKPFILINTSRGKNTDTKAVLDAMKTGAISGLCMDVFENEKLHTYSDEERELYSSLFILPNTIFSPHIAGWTIESKIRIAEILLKKITNWYYGPLKNKQLEQH